MIGHDLFFRFDGEISSLRAKISETQNRFQSEEDPEESQLLGIHLKALNKLVTAMTDTRNNVMTAALAYEGIEPKFRKWRQLCAVAREAKDKMESLEKLIEPARAAVVLAQNAVAAAEAALVRHQQLEQDLKQPGRYATGPELRGAKLAGEKLQREYDAALLKMRELADKRGGAERDWFDAKRAYDAACFAERMTRLPGEPEPKPGMATIHRVA